MEVIETVKDEHFIKLPNSLVWDVEGKRENTYAYQYGDKLCHIWSIFDCLMNRVGTISFSLEQLVTVLGLVADTHKGRNTDQFKSLLLGLKEKQFITNVKCNLKTVKYKELITCEYSIPMMIDKDSKDTQFFRVYRKDYIKLLDCDTKLNKITLMYIYYYLLSRMSNGKGDTTIYCFPTFGDITNDLNIAESTLNIYINELQVLELIAYSNIGLITKNGENKTANNVYVRHVSHLQNALEISKNYWTAEGWIITNKQVSKINGEIKGYKGQITKQKNAGKDTTKLEDKLARLEEKVTNKVDKSLNDIKREIKALNQKLNKIDEDNELETIVQSEWEDYFCNEGLDMYDIDDCADVLEHMKDIEKEQLKEITGQIKVIAKSIVKKEGTKEEVINEVNGRNIDSKDIKELKDIKHDLLNLLDKYENLPY